METYLVGGAVRNRLLGIPVTERDWVVVGSTPREMQAEGYVPVGKDFPVFLHPATQEEYALARTERKSGRGHTAFDVSTESVTLEDDLRRRDITINAMAEDGAGNVIDPWGGMADIRDKWIRHVSQAFSEDPLRVLRVARFAALLHHQSFRVHPDTLALMSSMVASGELSSLPPERIFRELQKALDTSAPEQFFEVLALTGAAPELWPELTPADVKRLATASRLTQSRLARFASLTRKVSVEGVGSLCERLRAPGAWSNMAKLVARHHSTWAAVESLTAAEIVNWFYAVDAYRQQDRFAELNDLVTLVETADGMAGARENALRWKHYFEETCAVTASSVGSSVQGPAVGQAIRDMRIGVLTR